MHPNGVGVDTRPDVVGGAGGGAVAGARISVRSRVNGTTSETVDLRRKMLVRYSGRAMTRRLLDGADLRDLRLRRCGFRLGEQRLFKVGPGGKARSVGIERCAAGRVCTVCGPAQAAVRAAEVGAAVWRWMTENDDHHAIFISTGASHTRRDRLEDVHDQWLTARGVLCKSDDRLWRAFKARYGIRDVAWKIEHSIGPNGPHVGLHLVLLTDRWWEAEDAQAAEAWLWRGFDRELKAAGFKGRLSPEQGIDIRPVDDPAGIGKYLTKWGVGRELAAESDKMGRNGVNVPYSAIPCILAEELGGRRDPHDPRTRRDPYVRRLVDGWVDFVKLATSDRKKWYSGFHQLKTIVPELKDAHRAQETIAICTDILPADLRPERYDDAEVDEDDDEEGLMLAVEGPAWEVIAHAWYRADRLSYVWARRRHGWLGGHQGCAVPIELAVLWMIEDEGVDAAAAALADLCGGEILGTEMGLTISLEAA